MARKALARDVLVKLLVPAGGASPSPPVGPALGSKGVKSMDFCKEFNARTAHLIPGTPVPALVTVRPDRSFTFTVRSPPTASLLMLAAGVSQVKNRPRGAGNTAGPRVLGAAVAAQVEAVAKEGAVDEGRQEVVEEEEEEEEGDEERGNDGEAGEHGEQDGRALYVVGKTGKASGKDLMGNANLGTVGTVSLKHVYEIAKIKYEEERLRSLGLEKIARSVVAQAGSMGILVVP